MLPNTRTIRAACALVFLLLLLAPAPSRETSAQEPKRIALLPFVLHADPSKGYLRSGIQSMLVSRLEGEGLSVLHGERVEVLLDGGDRDGVDSEERAEGTARELGVDYVVFGSVTTLGGGYSLDFSILDLTKDEPKRTQISETVDENQLITRLSDMAHQFRAVVDGVDFRRYQAARGEGLDGQSARGLFFQPGEGGYGFEPTGSASVRMGILSFDVGDCNDDGEPELFFMTPAKLMVYHREGERFVLQDSIECAMGERFLKVSVGDADLDGKDEIYLVSHYGERARSTVYDWDRSFQMRFRMWGHLQVDVGRDGRPPVIYFQDTMLSRYFNGDIMVMDYDRPDRLSPRFALPEFEKGVQFYSLIQCDIDGDGNREFIGLSDLSYLHVWDRTGKSLWATSAQMGGSNNAIQHGRKQTDGLAERIELNSRPEVMDVDENGSLEVLYFKNIPFIDRLTNLKLYQSARMYAYTVKGSALGAEWVTRELDFSIIDVRKSGETLYAAFVEGKFSKLSSARGKILWFE